MEEIKVGDVVELKSGGPPMTVENVGDYSNHGISDGAYCVWFDGKKRDGHVFARSSLKKVE